MKYNGFFNALWELGISFLSFPKHFSPSWTLCVWNLVKFQCHHQCEAVIRSVTRIRLNNVYHKRTISELTITWNKSVIGSLRSVMKKHRGRFNIKMPSYHYREPHCGDKTILRPSYLHNRISYTGKMASLYWISAVVVRKVVICGFGWPFHYLPAIYCSCGNGVTQWSKSHVKWMDWDLKITTRVICL